MMQLKLFASAAIVASLAFAAPALAQGTITNGANSVGIGANGELFNNNDGIGFRRDGDGFDPIAPGTPRDSWGVGVVGGASAYADQNNSGSSGITSTGQVFGPNSASYSTTTDFGLVVDQEYDFLSGGNILRIVTSVTNGSGGDFGEVLFQRNVDWDVDPTPFDEQISGPHGAFGPVVDSTFYGFENADPLAGGFAFSCSGGCGPDAGDLGGGIRISLGSLLSGATAKFVFYYGVSESGQSVGDLIAEGHAAGASYIIAGRSNDSNTAGQNSAFIGVGAFNAVPEPATWAMMILGFFGMGAMVRRRKAVIA